MSNKTLLHSQSCSVLDDIFVKLPDNAINDIRMYSHNVIDKILKDEIRKKNTKLKNTKNLDCICHLDRWCEECYGDFDLFDD